ncbi:hypothetical protein CEW46_23910 [Bacillus cereus]|nr:hypothetical protein CEW46_23910 [Bacillus cereus]
MILMKDKYKFLLDLGLSLIFAEESVDYQGSTGVQQVTSNLQMYHEGTETIVKIYKRTSNSSLNRLDIDITTHPETGSFVLASNLANEIRGAVEFQYDHDNYSYTPTVKQAGRASAMAPHVYRNMVKFGKEAL